ncbi:hypothetical protein [Halobacteriovorax sp. RT-2-4]|uniref:hypothetical protein n=1 Tax=unclassified Halobacteriovorax TaxID=2639665 RepID=UPI00399AD776
MKTLFISLLIASSLPLTIKAKEYNSLDFQKSAASYDKQLQAALMDFVYETKDIAYQTTFTPRYIVRYHERLELIAAYEQLDYLLHVHDEAVEKITHHIRKKNNAKALELIRIRTSKYKAMLSLMNYMMMSGENFISVFSDDFEDINYESKHFEADFKETKRQLSDSNRVNNQTGRNHISAPYNRYQLRYIKAATITDFHNLDDEVLKLAGNDKGLKLLVEDIENDIEEARQELTSFKSLLRETSWNAGRYTIFYNIKEFILKSFSYIALPIKHAIKVDELKKISEAEFEPGDVGAIQRYGKLSNLVFKGNWTHGLMFIGKYSKFNNYFKDDIETNEVFAKRCVSEFMKCQDYMSYLKEKYPESMKEYEDSEKQGRPYVTLEGLKPGVVFMELGPSMAWDNLVILRPNLTKKDKALALERTFKSIGKKYDYSFNGNSYSRFVCTELIQYSYETNPNEDKQGIEWDVNLVMGKPAMYGFDLVQTFINQIEDPTRKNQLSLVVYMKGLKKKELEQKGKTPDFGTAKRGTIQELKETL